MAFRVLARRMRLGDGSYRFRGEPIPEAADWPEHVRRARLRQDLIVEVADEPEPEPAPVEVVEPKPEPKAKAKPKAKRKRKAKV